MRELMIKEIQSSGWLDHDWSGKDIDLENRDQTAEYRIYLESLSDADLLRTYNRVREIEGNLD